MNFWLQGGRMRGKDRGIGMDMNTLLYLKWITNENLGLYSTWNSSSFLTAVYMVYLLSPSFTLQTTFVFEF